MSGRFKSRKQQARHQDKRRKKRRGEYKPTTATEYRRRAA